MNQPTPMSAKDWIDLVYQTETRAVYYWGFSVTVNTTVIIWLATLWSAGGLPEGGGYYRPVILGVHGIAYLMSLLALIMEQVRHEVLMTAIAVQLEPSQRAETGMPENPPAALLRHIAEEERTPLRLLVKHPKWLAICVHAAYLAAIWVLVLTLPVKAQETAEPPAAAASMPTTAGGTRSASVAGSE